MLYGETEVPLFEPPVIPEPSSTTVMSMIGETPWWVVRLNLQPVVSCFYHLQKFTSADTEGLKAWHTWQCCVSNDQLLYGALQIVDPCYSLYWCQLLQAEIRGQNTVQPEYIMRISKIPFHVISIVIMPFTIVQGLVRSEIATTWWSGGRLK
jgi:hypothetical protein